MALKTFVKISNVNNLSDARYCAGMYVDLMGFSLEENDEYFVSPTEFKEITDWLSGLNYVAEFKNYHPENILKTVKAYEGIDYIQIEEFAHLQMLLNAGYPLIYKALISSEEALETLLPIADTLSENQVIMNLESNNDLELTELGLGHLKSLASRCELLLGFGFTAETIEQVLAKTQIKGISMKGGHEIKPGIKDFDELADILEILELED